MKFIIIAVLLAVCNWGLASAQDVYVSKDAGISFFSSAPIEDIQAQTNKAVSAINIKTGAVYFKVPIKSFRFEKSLMQNHFNSDYLESDKYPFAEFNGKIVSLPDLTTDNTYPVSVAGKLTLHGVTKDYTTPGTITVSNGKLTVAADFKVRLADHQITVPRLLLRNIAEVVDVKVKAAYAPDSSSGAGSEVAGSR